MIKTILYSLIKKYKLKLDNRRLLKMDWVEATPIQNVKPNKIEKIVFVIPSISAYGGGITSVFRLGSYLNEKGYDITYASYDYSQQRKEMITAAKLCLADFKGKLIYLSDIPDEDTFDVVVATNVISVYFACRLKGYKMTFVQDYEPFFDAAGDWNYFALKSYTLGFHMVSLGCWNKYMIQKNVDSTLHVDIVTFPYEKNEYQYIDRSFDSYKDKKFFKLCVYMRETPRRLPGVCQIISMKLKSYFEADGKELEIFYFGSDKKIFYGGKNLGKLNKTQLNELYQACDFGMVFSYTNISLIPFEMMATGLPIIELAEGSFPFFFKDAAFLFDLNYEKLYKEIKYAIDNPEILIERDKTIQQELSCLSWKSTAGEFSDILQNLVAR